MEYLCNEPTVTLEEVTYGACLRNISRWLYVGARWGHDYLIQGRLKHQTFK